MTLGAFLINFRKESGLSYQDFSALCDLSVSYINKLESGVDSRSGKKVSPTLETYQRIAKAAKLTLTELLIIVGEIEGEESKLNLIERNTLDGFKKLSSDEQYRAYQVLKYSFPDSFE